jgi:2,3-dihydroxy-p-cumate/2,3-dihydroxybenzoate 3,4-dioxygenase
LAYHSAQSSGVLAIEYEVEGVDQLMQNSYFLQSSQIRIVHGPGRRPASGQLFITFEGPDGVLYSFVAEGEKNAVARRPRQFAAGAASYCAWGSPCMIKELSAP